MVDMVDFDEKSSPIITFLCQLSRYASKSPTGGLVSLFNGISTSMGFFNAEAIFVKEQ